MTAAALGRFAPAFQKLRHMLASIVDEQSRWIVFGNIINEAAGLVAEGCPKQAAVDEMHELACAEGFTAKRGDDQVQKLLAEKFADVEPDQVPDDIGNFEDYPPLHTNGKGSGGETEVPLPYVDLALDPIPPREWLVLERIPMRNVSLLSGEGSIGKSLLMMQLSGATVLAKDWIGTMPEPGPVLYMSCEEDDDEVCRRMEAVAAHFGSTRHEMVERGLRFLSFAGRDAVLGQPDRSGIIRPTSLFERLRRDALQLRPKLIVFDTVADIFGGNEIARSQVRQFITMLRGLAIETGSAVVIAAHPSLTGITSDSGLSGSTAWHNGPRARMYFKPAPSDDTALRVLEVKKNNYGPVNESILLRWKNGVYVPEPRAGSLEKLAEEQAIDNLFLTLLRRFTEQGRNVSDKQSPTHAPTLFAGEPEAKKAKITKKALAESMARLFAANKLRVVTIGSASRMRSRIVEVDGEPHDRATVVPFPTPLPTPLPTAFQHPSNGVLTHTPHTPHTVGRGKGVLEAPAPSNGKEGEEGKGDPPRSPAGTRCELCGKGGVVFRIKLGTDGTSDVHEKCAQDYRAKMEGEQED